MISLHRYVTFTFIDRKTRIKPHECRLCVNWAVKDSMKFSELWTVSMENSHSLFPMTTRLFIRSWSSIQFPRKAWPPRKIQFGPPRQTSMSLMCPATENSTVFYSDATAIKWNSISWRRYEILSRLPHCWDRRSGWAALPLRRSREDLQCIRRYFEKCWHYRLSMII